MRTYVKTLSTLALAAVISLPAGSARAQEKKEKQNWYDTVKVGGDVRVRYERIDEDGKDVRNRARIRARLGASGKANEDVDVKIGLATGSADDPVSRNQTLTEGFTPKDILLDYAFVDWHPAQIEGLSLLGGKLINPFEAVTDVIWDGDVTPEGGAVKYTLGDEWKAQLVGAALTLEERSSDDDSMVYGAQLKLSGALSEMLSLAAGVSYYQFSNIEGFDVIDPAGKKSSYGNSTRSVVEDGVTNKVYAYEYQLVEPFVSLTANTPVPVTVFANYVRNTEPDDDNTGYGTGVKLGKAKDPGSFELSYLYKKVEKDATLGLLTDSDAWGGGTDGKAHKISAAYQINKNWQAGVTYFIATKGLEKDVDYNRLQLDLVAKF